MVRVGVLGEEKCEQTKAILEAFSINPAPLGPYHIVIMNSSIKDAGHYLTQIVPNGVLLVNSDDKDIKIQLPAKKIQIITYGLNQKACVTASSLLEEKAIQCCVQRAIPTLMGEELCPQEFSIGLSVPQVQDIYSVLAGVTAAIVGNIPIERVASVQL